MTQANLGDNYNWAVFDITNRNPDDVYTDPSLFLGGNWSGTYGVTGATAGPQPVQCASDNSMNITPYSAQPPLVQGHTYLLLVTHYTDTPSGFNLSFIGGTAVITNPNIRALGAIEADCDGVTVLVKMNQQIKCKSVATDGSDFTLQGTSSTIISATVANCGTDSTTDSVILKLNSPLTPGNYTLGIQVGSDGNTLLDNCDNSVTTNDNLSFSMSAQTPPTPMDSLTKVECGPKTLQLVFRKAIQCSSIAADGSDFSISGSSPVIIQSASGVCTDGKTNTILLQLSQPIPAGNYQLQLKTGSDGNTIIDACQQPTPAGSSIQFGATGGCVIAVPSAFTPNGDGHNDYLYPLNSSKANNLEFRVYNRNGQLIFSSRDGSKKWDGTFNGKAQDTGTYVWTLQYTDKESGKKVFMKG
ncbi:MAG TPA: gliding motility-associated C-terminal domain-containing protein, partial [Puia sp.]|nr:gliding motility-associated C-terminal domain-containing protein [Puia sp.]